MLKLKKNSGAKILMQVLNSETAQLDLFPSFAVRIPYSVGRALEATLTVPILGDKSREVCPDYLCSWSCSDLCVSVYVDGLTSTTVKTAAVTPEGCTRVLAKLKGETSKGG